jgi:hypothetical protein
MTIGLVLTYTRQRSSRLDAPLEPTDRDPDRQRAHQPLPFLVLLNVVLIKGLLGRAIHRQGYLLKVGRVLRQSLRDHMSNEMNMR